MRGWTLEKFGLRVTLRGTGGGSCCSRRAPIALIVVRAVGRRRSLPTRHGGGRSRVSRRSAPDSSMQLVFLASVVNGVFEELFVAGYVITALAPARGMWTAINVSTGMRLLYHLYQGPIGVLTIVPMGLLYGYVYVAHAAALAADRGAHRCSTSSDSSMARRR